MAISLSFGKTSSSTSLIIAPQFSLSEKNDFTVSQNSLLSVKKKKDSAHWKTFFLFYKVYCNKFSIFFVGSKRPYFKP